MFSEFKSKFKFFKKFDIFGCPVALTMKKEDTYKTVFGGFLTLTINAFFLLVVIYSFYMLFTKQTLQTNKYELNLGGKYGLLNLTAQTFMMAIKFDAENLNNWTNPYINVTMQHVTQYRNSTTIWKTKKPIKLKVCDHSDFVGLEKDFDQLGLKTSLCPIKGTLMPLQGNFQEETFSYFQVILTTCSNKTICQSNSTIYKTISLIDKLNIDFFITNNIVDERNFEQPITRQIVSDMHFLVDPIKSVYRTSDIFLNEVEITTDSGVFPSLFPTTETNISYTYSQEFREQTIFTTLDASQKVNIGDFYFRKSQNKFKYDRFLGNLLTVLSYLGGIWSSIYIWFAIMAGAYSRNFFMNSLANKLYNYPSQKRKKTKKQPKAIEENESPLSPNMNESKKSVYSKMMTKIEAYLSYDRKLYLTFCDMWRFIFESIFFCYRFKDEKYVLMKKTKENLNKDLDICNILKKIHELEKIKNILFSDEQQLMLGFSPKPDVYSSDVDPSLLQMTSSGLKTLSKSIRLKRRKKSRLLEEEVNFDDIKPFRQLIFAWKTLKTAKQNSLMINENLVKMFGDEFSKTLDITEDEMQVICNQSKEVGKKFFNLISNLKHNNDDQTQSILSPTPLIGVSNSAKLTYSESYIDAPETNDRLVIVGNKIEKITSKKSSIRMVNSKTLKQYKSPLKVQLQTKLNNIKDKLGLGHLKIDLRNYQQPSELTTRNQEVELVQQETRDEMLTSKEPGGDVPFLKKKPPIFKSFKVVHDDLPKNEAKEKKNQGP